MTAIIDWDRVLRHGSDLAVDAARAGQDIRPENVMWELFREACNVSKTYAGPPRLGYPAKSSLPEALPEFTAWQHMAAYLRGEVDEMPETEPGMARPSAAQISRAEAVLWLWHEFALKRKGNRKALRKAVYAMGCGAPPRAILARTGIARASLYRARDTAMADMWEGMRKRV